jgi:NUMOD3 motif-containing protein
MAHRKNDRPTFIYWLFDSLTSVPFYCGKTVLPLEKRLAGHKHDAIRGKVPVHNKVRELGENVRIQFIDIVPPEDDWGTHEKRWIALLRSINPLCCNVTSGGQGCPGRVVSDETRAKMSAWQIGRKLTEEHKAKVRMANLGKKRTPESVAKSAAGTRGRKMPPEHGAAISARNKARFAGPQREELLRLFTRKGVPVSAETRAKQSAAHMGRKKTPEEKAKLRVAGLGRKMSPEAIAKSVAARLGRKRTPEQRARMSTAHKGKKWSQARREAAL